MCAGKGDMSSVHASIEDKVQAISAAVDGGVGREDESGTGTTDPSSQASISSTSMKLQSASISRLPFECSHYLV